MQISPETVGLLSGIYYFCDTSAPSAAKALSAPAGSLHVGGQAVDGDAFVEGDDEALAAADLGYLHLVHAVLADVHGYALGLDGGLAVDEVSRREGLAFGGVLVGK